MTASSRGDILSEVFDDLKSSKGVNKAGSFQKFITKTKKKASKGGFFIEVDPEIYQKKQVVPLVIPQAPVSLEGAKSYTPKGYPETPQPEDFGITEPDRLISARSNTPGLEITPYSQLEIQTFVRDVRKHQRRTEDRLPENPTTKEGRVSYLRKFFNLGPETGVKKTTRK